MPLSGKLMSSGSALLFLAACCSALWGADGSPQARQQPPYSIELTTVRQGFDGETCWVHARAGAIPAKSKAHPGPMPLVVMTMQKLVLSGSDLFGPLNELRSSDMGRSWSSPVDIAGMERQVYAPDHPSLPTGAAGFTSLLQPKDETLVCDFTPQWHAATQTLLGIGHTVWYRDHHVLPVRPRATAYAAYDAATNTWKPWKVLELPDSLQEFSASGAGCVQRYDLPSGDILLPVYGKPVGGTFSDVIVLHCRFDGDTLSYVSHGNTISIPSQRGLAEPSLTKFDNRFYLTLRHNERGYVCVSEDGLQFSEPRPWTFDDGSDLGNYNTQQHWVTHSNGLFLVYTRKGANNDHVFRHRAPLFIAQVDCNTLRIRRDTEQVLVPERGARLGNFGVTDVTPNETWVTVTEWMQPRPPRGMPEQYGSDNSVFVAKIKWQQPNQLMPAIPTE